MYVCVFKQFLDVAKPDLFYTRIDHFNKILCNFHETAKLILLSSLVLFYGSQQLLFAFEDFIFQVEKVIC